MWWRNMLYLLGPMVLSKTLLSYRSPYLLWWRQNLWYLCGWLPIDNILHRLQSWIRLVFLLSFLWCMENVFFVSRLNKNFNEWLLFKWVHKKTLKNIFIFNLILYLNLYIPLQAKWVVRYVVYFNHWAHASNNWKS